MKKISVQQALSNAILHEQEGEFLAATKIYKEILNRCPDNKKAKEGLKHIVNLQRSFALNEPNQIIIDQLMMLYEQGKLKELILETNNLLHKYQNSASLWNVLGIASAQISRFDDAIFAFEKIIMLRPNEARAHYNLGNVLKDNGQIREAIFAYARAAQLKHDYAEANNNFNLALEHLVQIEMVAKPALEKSYDNLATTGFEIANLYVEIGNELLGKTLINHAVKAFKKAIEIWPKSVAAYNSLGIAFAKQGLTNEAERFYKQAISINHNYFAAYNNLGNSYKSRGMLDKALAAYRKSLEISGNKDDRGLAHENLLNLQIQLKNRVINDDIFSSSTNKKIHVDAKARPMFEVLNAINSFLDAKKINTQRHIENFKACAPGALVRLEPKQRHFCSSYSSYLELLLKERPKLDLGSRTDNLIYHLGESHCLSFAYQVVGLMGKRFHVVPRLTLGGKAFHFGVEKNNSFKAITKNNLASIPKGSEVFVSFGEIDCRPNEGILSAAKKLNKPLEEIVASTVTKYLKWFNNHNRGLKHQLYFFNVPAAFYDSMLSEALNADVSHVISLFNQQMKKQSYQYNFKVIDVHMFTVGSDGFSTGQFHIDKKHLSVKAIPKIEAQLIS